MSSTDLLLNVVVYVLPDTEIGLCKFHRKQAWTRYLVAEPQKEKLLEL